MYGFLSQVISWADTAMERRYAYCRMLIRRVAEDRGQALDVSDELQMTHYHLDQTFTGEVEADESDVLPTAFPGGGFGALTEPEQLALADVLEAINERYGLNLNESHRLLTASIGESMTDDADLQVQAANNPKHKFRLAMDSKLEAALFAHLDDHTGLVKTIIETPEIQALLVPAMLDFVYRRAGDKHRATTSAPGTRGHKTSNSTRQDEFEDH